MSQPKRYSLADVRRSYTEEKAWRELTGELPAYLLYRPLSFPLSYLALRMGVPIAAVTWSGLLLSLGMVVAAIRCGPHAYLCVAGLGLAFHLLDCVDGNMARTTGKATRFGAILDGFADGVFYCALFFALGLLTEREHRVPWADFGVELGLVASMLVLLNRKVRDHYALLAGVPSVLGESRVARPSLRQWALYAVAGLENLYVIALALAGAFHAIWLVLLCATLYASAVSVVAIWLTLSAARRDDATPSGSSERTHQQAHVLPAKPE